MAASSSMSGRWSPIAYGETEVFHVATETPESLTLTVVDSTTFEVIQTFEQPGEFVRYQLMQGERFPIMIGDLARSPIIIGKRSPCMSWYRTNSPGCSKVWMTSKVVLSTTVKVKLSGVSVAT